MNFEKAYKALLNGDSIRRKEWESLMHIKKIKDIVKTYRGEYTNFYADTRVLISDGWFLLDDPSKEMNFIDVIEALKAKKQVKHKSWEDQRFIFLDKDKIALCKAVEYEFMPSWLDLTSVDWELMKT